MYRALTSKDALARRPACGPWHQRWHQPAPAGRQRARSEPARPGRPPVARACQAWHRARLGACASQARPRAPGGPRAREGPGQGIVLLARANADYRKGDRSVLEPRGSRALAGFAFSSNVTGWLANPGSRRRGLREFPGPGVTRPGVDLRAAAGPSHTPESCGPAASPYVRCRAGDNRAGVDKNSAQPGGGQSPVIPCCQVASPGWVSCPGISRLASLWPLQS